MKLTFPNMQDIANNGLAQMVNGQFFPKQQATRLWFLHFSQENADLVLI